MKTAREGGIADIGVEVMAVEEVVIHYLLEGYRSAGLACKHSHFVVGEGEAWNEGVAAVSDSSSFCGLCFARTAVIRYTVAV